MGGHCGDDKLLFYIVVSISLYIEIAVCNITVIAQW